MIILLETLGNSSQYWIKLFTLIWILGKKLFKKTKTFFKIFNLINIYFSKISENNLNSEKINEMTSGLSRLQNLKTMKLNMAGNVIGDKGSSNVINNLAELNDLRNLTLDVKYEKIKKSLEIGKKYI